MLGRQAFSLANYQDRHQNVALERVAQLLWLAFGRALT